MKLRQLLIVSLTAIPLTLFGVPGCEDEGALEEAGETMDEGMDDAGDALEDLGDDIKEGADDLKDDIDG